MANNRYKSISRIDQSSKKHHGWYVRVYFKGKIHSKFFNDRHYNGDSSVALSEAIEWRNETEERIGKPRSDRFVVRSSPRNTSGVVGVRKTSDDRWYQVTWAPEPNRLKSKFISINEYGDKEAFRMACELRRQKEREYYGGEIRI